MHAQLTEVKGNIRILCDGDWERPQVEVSGSWQALAGLGALLKRATAPVTVPLGEYSNTFYPVSVRALHIEPQTQSGGRLTVSVDQIAMVLKGDAEAFDKLGQSLENCFDRHSRPGHHFHLDYYEGNDLLNQTNCSLIFMCRED